MTSLLTLDSLSLRTPDDRTLFSGLTLAVGSERVGLVGRNGSGKSSLIRTIAGLAEPASGTMQLASTVGMLEQAWPERWTVAEALGVADRVGVLRRVLSGQGTSDDFEAADWTLDARIEAALTGAGLPGIPLDRAMGTFSGGERMRIGMAGLLVDKPDLLLLDEPTNNLDASGREAIRELVRGWSGGLLVASHDRELLELMDRIVELTPIGVRVVGGGWSRFAALRAAERERAAGELERSQSALQDAQRTAQQQRESKERRDRAGRAFAARGSEPKILLDARAARAEASGGRLNRLGERKVGEAAARAEEAASRVEVVTPLTVTLPASSLPSGAQVLALDAVFVDLPKRRLGPWTFDIRGPERIAVRGPNGSGKTTLLKIAAGVLEPDGGSVRRAGDRIAMLDQHIGSLEPGESIVANYRRLNPAVDEQDARAACARFAFRNRDALRLVGTLSGGERLRAGLACTLAGASPPWLLILDEPTNHLDIESLELLEQALRDFDGALAVVSHDVSFLEAIGIEREFVLDPGDPVPPAP